MSEYYIIAAGGTGAMCTRAFIYMAAAGCVDSNSEYHVLLVDKDKESDSMTACENLLEDYKAMREQMGKKPGTYAFPKIVLNRWNFTEEILDEYEIQTGKSAANLKSLTLNNLLNPDNDPQIYQMLSTMYSDDELQVDLQNGFYGHPNVGAPVFDYVQKRFLAPKTTRANGTEVINTFMTSLHATLSKGKAYVYLFGSLFGGTGATVIPNVVLALRTLKDDTGINYGETRLVLGGSVVMPYFRLPRCQVDSIETLEKVAPMDTKFAEQTREALSYYHESKLLGNMMNLLLVGATEPDVTSENFSRGGCQHQHFHGVLLLAAVGACRFFANQLGAMAPAVAEDPVIPQGELLLWKFVPDDGKGSYATLTPGELDLTDEYDKMVAFLRYSVVVGYYMRLKFQKDPNELKEDVEIQGTAMQMGLDRKKLRVNEIKLYYQDPVAKAGAICYGFINFMYDVALSGFDWSTYREYVRKGAPRVVDKKEYYEYEPGPVDANAPARFGTRWMDFANLDDLKKLLEADKLSQVMNTMTLNSINSYEMLDEGRTPYAVKGYENSIATVYETHTLPALRLRRNMFGKMVRTDAYFCEIYDELHKRCY